MSFYVVALKIHSTWTKGLNQNMLQHVNAPVHKAWSMKTCFADCIPGYIAQHQYLILLMLLILNVEIPTLFQNLVGKPSRKSEGYRLHKKYILSKFKTSLQP